MKKFLLGVLVGIITSVVGFIGFAYILANNFLDKVDDDVLSAPAMNVDHSNLIRASFDMDLVDLRSGVSLDSNILKNKVVLLNFWERWCIPCRQEMPSLERLSSIVKDTSLIFCIISTENEAATKKESFVTSYSLPFYHLKSVIPKVYDNKKVPRSYLINKQGQVVAVEIGAFRWDDNSVVKMIESLKMVD